MATNGKYVVEQNMPAQQRAMVIGDGNTAWDSFFDAYQAASLKGDQAVFEVYGGEYNTSNFPEINIKANDSLRITADLLENGYKTTPFTITDIDFVNNGTVTIKRSILADADTDMTVTFTLASTTEKKTTFKNNSSLTVENAAFIADKVVNGEDAEIVLKNATFTVPVVENAGLVRITGGEFAATEFTGGGTVWIATTFNNSTITGDNDFIVKYATTLTASSIEGSSLSVDLGNLTLNGSALAFDDVTIASGKYLFVDGASTINFGSVTGIVSVKADAVLSDSTVNSGTVYFGKNTGLIGENFFDVIQVSGASKDAESDDYRKLTIGDDTAPEVDPETGDVTFATELTANKIQLGSATKYGNLDIQNAKIDVATLNSANADNVVTVAGESDLTIGNLTGSINLANGADVTATVTDAAEGAAFNVGYTTTVTDVFDPATIAKNYTGTRTQISTEESFADVAALAGVAEDVDVNVAGGTLNVLGTAIVDDVETSVASPKITGTTTTLTYKSGKITGTSDPIVKRKDKNLTGTVNVGTKDGKTEASLTAGDITNAGAFNVYGKAILDADDIANAGTLNFAKGSFIAVDDIEGDAENKTGTVSIASENAVISSITDQKSVSIASGANLTGVKAISENTAVTITAASVEVNELLDNGTVTIGKGASTLTVEEFAGTITMADGAILADSVIGADPDQKPIAETENNVIYVGTSKDKLYKKNTEVPIGQDGDVTIYGTLTADVQTYKSNTATFAGASIAAADLNIDGGTANVTGLLALDDIALMNNTLPGPKVTFKAGTEEGTAVVKSNGSAVSTLNIAAEAADAELPAVVVTDAVTNAGAINVGTKTNAGKLIVLGTDEGEALTNNGTVTVNAKGKLEADTFVNAKTLTLSGTADIDTLGNTGTATVNAGAELTAGDIVNDGVFNVKGNVVADSLTNNQVANKKFEVTGRADIAGVDNAGLINVFGRLNVGTFTEVEGEEDPEFEGCTLTNIGEIIVGGTAANGGYLNAGDIINGKFAEGEEGEEGYEPAVTGAITVGWTGEVQPEVAVTSGLIADSITNYVGTISVLIDSYIDAGTITNYGTITVNPTEDGEGFGKLFANTIVNAQGAVLTLAGTLGSFDDLNTVEDDETQVMTIVNMRGDEEAEIEGGVVTFARVTNLQNVVLKDGEFAVAPDKKAYFDQLSLMDGANLSITSLYAADDAIKGTITIDALSSIACGDETQYGVKSGTIIFDADAVLPLGSEIKSHMVVDGYVADGVELYLKQGDELVEVTDSIAVTINGEDYALIKRSNGITLTEQSQKNVFINKEWSVKEIGEEFTASIVYSDGTTAEVSLIYGFNAFGEFSDITYSTYSAEMPPKVPVAQNIFLNADTYNPENVGKKYFFYTSDQDVVFDVNPILNPENPENDNYTVTLDTGRTYLMKAVNYNKVQTGIDPDTEKPIIEYSVTDNDGNVITGPSEDFPTFTIAKNLILEAGTTLKVGDVLDDVKDTEDWDTIAPTEEGEYYTFKPTRSGGVANLVVEGQLNKSFLSVNPYSTVTVAETGKVIHGGGIDATITNCSYIRNTATVTVNGAFEDGEAAGEDAAAADLQFQMYRVAFADGGTLNLNDTRAEISVLRLYNPAGAILDGTTAVINISNSYVDTTTNDIEPSDTTRFFSPDSAETTKQAVELNLTNGSVLNLKKDFNPLADTTVTVTDSAVIGGVFTNNGTIELDGSEFTFVSEDKSYNYGTIEVTNQSVFSADFFNAATQKGEEWIGGEVLVQDSTISGYLYNYWVSSVLVEDSVVLAPTLVNDGSFTVTGDSSLSAEWLSGKFELVSATLTDSVIATTENAGYLNIAANVPNDDPDAEPVANEVSFAGGNSVKATIENAGMAMFTSEGEDVNAIATFNNAEDATLAISGNLTKAGENEASIKNDGTASATGATIDYVMLNNNGEFTLSGTSLTSNSSSAVWNKGTFEASAKSTLNAAIKNQGVGAVTIDDSTVTALIDNDSANGTVTVKNGSKIASATNKGTFSMTASDAVGDISNSKTFTANGGSIIGDITNAADATFTMKNGATFYGAYKPQGATSTSAYTITNNGTFNLENAKITGFNGDRSKGATIDNTNGTFNVSGNDFEVSAKSITTASGDVKKFNVKGTGKLDVVTLSGRIRIDDNTTLNSANIDNGAAGELYVASGKTLTLKADSTFKNTLITNAGTIKAEKALSTKLDNNNIGALDNKNNATVNVTGDMTVGTVTNAGTINASANVTTNAFTNNDGKTFKATGSGKTVTVNGELSNSGTFDVTGNLATNGNAITNVKNNMTVGGTLKTTKQNAASGNVTIYAGSITATGAMEVGDVANNGGTLTAKAGLKAGAVTNGDGKTIKVTGALNTTGKITNSGSLTADSVATNGKDIENVKNTFTVNGALSTTKQNAASGSVTVTSGKIDVTNNGAATIGALTVGVVNGGSGTFNAASLNSGDVMVNRGTVSITGAATVGTLGIGDANSGTFTAASLESNAITVTKGTVTITNAIRAKGIITNSGTISAGSVDSRGYAITNNAGATFTVTGDLTTKPDSGNNYGAVTNSGTFKVGGTVTSGAFTNNAGGNFTINAKADKSVTMTVNGNFSNTGTLTIDVTAISGIKVGEQVQVVSVTGAVDAGNITLLNSDGSFKKIIQTTGDARGIYLYKTNEIPSAPTIYVNSAWSANKPGDTIKFPTEKDTLTFGLDAFASTDSVDLAADTTALKIINRGSYNTLNIGQSLDVTIWDDTGLAPSTTAQIIEHLNVSGNETVASFQGQKISTTDATIAEGATLDLRSSAIMDRDPSTQHTGANATLKVTESAGKLLTDWNSTLNLSGSLLADGMLDIDVTGYSDGADVTIIRGYGQENHYKAAIGAAKYNKYFKVSGNDLKMNTQAREVLYVDSNYGNAITEAVNYTWNGNDGTYHADTIVILGKSFSGSQYLEGIKDQTVIVRDGATFTALFGGVLRTTLGNKLTSSVEVDSEQAKVDLHLQIDGATFNNVLVAGDRINLSKAAASENKGIFTRYGETNLTINSGTFNSWVVGGQYFQPATTSIAQIGGTNIVINGGTFKDIVYGGSLTSNISYSTLATVTGTTNVTINAGENAIDLKKLVVGSYGGGIIEGGTKLTLTGNLTDDAASFKIGDIWGGSGSDKYDKDTHDYRGSVEGDRILSFTGFKGELGASSVGGFSNVVVDKNSSVKLNAGANALSYANEWEIEFAGNGATSISGAFENDFGNDTLTLKGIDTMAANDSWTVFGNDVTLTNYDTLGVVFGDGAAVNFADGAWTKGEFRLTYNTENGMVLTRSAIV